MSQSIDNLDTENDKKSPAEVYKILNSYLFKDIYINLNFDCLKKNICTKCQKGKLIRDTAKTVKCNICGTNFLSIQEDTNLKDGINNYIDELLEKSNKKSSTFILRSDKKTKIAKSKIEKPEPERMRLLNLFYKKAFFS
jgi:ribosomal protein L37AE/L43A